MSLRIRCKCERVLSFKPEHAGKSCKCPECGITLKIPVAKTVAAKPAAAKPVAALQAGVGSPTMNAGAPSDLRAPEGVQKTATCPSCKEPLAVEKLVCPTCMYSKRLKRKLKKTPIPVAKKSKDKKKEKVRAKPREKSSIFTDSSIDWATMGVGMMMMLGAGLWLGAGLMAGYIFPYPVLLFGFGAFTSLKGFAGS